MISDNFNQSKIILSKLKIRKYNLYLNNIIKINKFFQNSILIKNYLF